MGKRRRQKGPAHLPRAMRPYPLAKEPPPPEMKPWHDPLDAGSIGGSLVLLNHLSFMEPYEVQQGIDEAAPGAQALAMQALATQEYKQATEAYNIALAQLALASEGHAADITKATMAMKGLTTLTGAEDDAMTKAISNLEAIKNPQGLTIAPANLQAVLGSVPEEPNDRGCPSVRLERLHPREPGDLVVTLRLTGPNDHGQPRIERIIRWTFAEDAAVQGVRVSLREAVDALADDAIIGASYAEVVAGDWEAHQILYPEDAASEARCFVRVACDALCDTIEAQDGQWFVPGPGPAPARAIEW